MPTFGKVGGFAAKFMSKSPFSKTIAKDAGIPPIEEEDDKMKFEDHLCEIDAVEKLKYKK